MESITDYQNKLERLKGQRDSFKELLKESRRENRKIRKEIKNSELAQNIIQTVAKQTQENLIYNIENIVNTALASVFEEDPYEFKIDFVIRRNKTEADLYFVRDGQRIDPLNSSGFGVVDVTSMALRIACYALSSPKTRPVFIWDEPAKHLSTDLQGRYMAMIKELSDKLGIQFIIVTHIPDVSEFSDRTFKVTKKGLYSKVEVLDGT